MLGVNREMHATGMYEKEIDLLYAADSERTCIRDEQFLMHV